MIRKMATAVLLVAASTGGLTAQGDYRKGFSYYQQNQYNKAIAEFEAIVKEQPDYEFGHRILGFSYLKIKQYDKAIASLREAIRLSDDNFSTYRALALAYFNSGSFQQVIPTLDKAERYAKSPRDKYDVYKMRGSAAYNAGNFSRAAEDLEKALAIQQGGMDDALQLGIAYYHLNEFEKAERYLKQALAIDPQQALATRYLSRIGFQKGVDLIRKKRYAEASKALREFVDRKPDDADGWFNLGLAYLFADNLNAAEESFLRAVSLAPGNAEAHQRLGYIYEKKKQYQKALASYQKAAQLDGGDEARESVQRVRKRIEQAGQSG